MVDRDTPVTVRRHGRAAVGVPRRPQADRRARCARRRSRPGLRCLDAGASTGGFTDVLLDRGAAQVVAVDVGYGQLVWRLRSDERVQVHDRTNVRALTPAEIGGPVQLTVADLSFISLRTVLPALAACTGRRAAADGQAAVRGRQAAAGGRRRGARSGVAARRAREVAAAARELGLRLRRSGGEPAARPVGQRRVLPAACAATARDVGDAALARRPSRRVRSDPRGAARPARGARHQPAHRRRWSRRQLAKHGIRLRAHRGGVGRGRRDGDLPGAACGRRSSRAAGVRRRRRGGAGPRRRRHPAAGRRAGPAHRGAAARASTSAAYGFLAEAEEEFIAGAIDAIVVRPLRGRGADDDRRGRPRATATSSPAPGR